MLGLTSPILEDSRRRVIAAWTRGYTIGLVPQPVGAPDLTWLRKEKQPYSGHGTRTASEEAHLQEAKDVRVSARTGPGIPSIDI